MKLSTVQVRVLKAAAAGTLSRSESVATLYQSYILPTDTREPTKNVTRSVNALTHMDPPLLKIGEPVRWRRPWSLTEAGEKALVEATATA